jgi:hypothetical protein
VTITGGSVNANPAHVDPAPSNGIARVSCVVVDGFAHDTAVAFDGLPDYYGTAGIYADSDGKAYLWLPEDWTTPVTPKLLMAAPKSSVSGHKLLKASGAGTQHTFTANGYSYSVAISSEGGEVSAAKGNALKLSDLEILGFAVEDGVLCVMMRAKPNTWLYGFADRLIIRASSSLPMKEDDSSELEVGASEMQRIGNDSAICEIPLENDNLRFFRIEEKKDDLQ